MSWSGRGRRKRKSYYRYSLCDKHLRILSPFIAWNVYDNSLNVHVYIFILNKIFYCYFIFYISSFKLPNLFWAIHVFIIIFFYLFVHISIYTFMARSGITIFGVHLTKLMVTMDNTSWTLVTVLAMPHYFVFIFFFSSFYFLFFFIL